MGSPAPASPEHAHTTVLRYATAAPVRIDVWLSAHVQTLSRSRWQELIREGLVRINGATCKPHHQLHDGDEIAWTVPESHRIELRPEAIPLDVLFEDADLIVLNKQPGLVIHPAPGHDSGTLVNALLHHCTDLQGIGGELRPGIVHRLDRDTSGVLVAAKSEIAMHRLAAQFKNREVEKEYVALVWGVPRRPRDTIHTRIGRSLRDRKKMAVLPLGASARADAVEGEDDEPSAPGREAVTHYEVEEAFAACSLLRLRIETGRTHQIRVHLAHMRHPVIGDTTYGRARAQMLPAPVTRQMLHAEKLTFTHPRTRERMTFVAPLAADFCALLDALRGN